MQRDAIVANLSTVPRGKSMKAKDYTADLLSWDQYDAAMQAAIAPYLYQVIIDVGQEAMREIGMQPSTYDPFRPNIKRYQDERNTKIASDVNDETEKQLRATITEGVINGESTHEIRARIEQVFGFASTTRADRIASTEVARAQGFADIEAWSQSGVVSQKEWYTAHDERVCPFCGPMDGTVIGLQDNYFNKGDVQIEQGQNRNGEDRTFSMNHSYDNVTSPPLHNNCRCVLLPVRG